MMNGKRIMDQCEKMDQTGARQIVFTGALGTGKTYTAVKFARAKVLEAYNAHNSPDDEKDRLYKKHIYAVQFNASYGFSEFFEVLRVVKTGKNKKLVRIDGLFKAFCRKIIESEDEKPYFFIIDEIKRAELSDIFGELIYCLDEDNRSSGKSVRTKYSNLPTYALREEDADCGFSIIERDVFKDGFYIPKNLYILATMNDIAPGDETFDFAFGRRFTWIEADAEAEAGPALREMLKGKADDEKITELAYRLKAMNAIIANKAGRGEPQTPGEKLGLTSDYHIGHAYFKNYTYDGKRDNLQEIWDTQICPILKEYCRGKDPGSTVEFIAACREALGVPD